MTERACYQCAWAEHPATGHARLKLHCRCPAVLKASGQADPVSVARARVEGWCGYEDSPHWAPMPVKPVPKN